jgi:hypothetical protein
MEYNAVKEHFDKTKRLEPEGSSRVFNTSTLKSYSKIKTRG